MTGPTEPLHSDPVVSMVLPADSENVAVVRHALAGAIEALGGDREVIDDVKLAVTEACGNVVLHAYDPNDPDRRRRPLQVALYADNGAVTIAVRDHGSGMLAHAAHAKRTPGLGLGMPLMAALARHLEARGRAGGPGTEMVMTFDLTPAAQQA